MHKFTEVDTPLSLQGKTTIFRNFILESVNALGSRLVILDADYAANGKPIMIFSKDHEQAAYLRPKNSIFLKKKIIMEVPRNIFR